MVLVGLYVIPALLPSMRERCNVISCLRYADWSAP